MTYYTLMTREDDGKWYPQFGDYERAVALEECHEYYQMGYKRQDIKIVKGED